MKKLSLLAIGAAALTVAGFSSAASAREHVSFGIFLGGPPMVEGPRVVVEERYRDPEADYWAHRRGERERWEARERRREHCEHERWRAEHARHWHDWDD